MPKQNPHSPEFQRMASLLQQAILVGSARETEKYAQAICKKAPEVIPHAIQTLPKPTADTPLAASMKLFGQAQKVATSVYQPLIYLHEGLDEPMGALSLQASMALANPKIVGQPLERMSSLNTLIDGDYGLSHLEERRALATAYVTSPEVPLKDVYTFITRHPDFRLGLSNNQHQQLANAVQKREPDFYKGVLLERLKHRPIDKGDAMGSGLL